MEPVTLAVLGILVVAVVLVPLAREYGYLRRAHGLSRTAAFGTTAIVVAALGLGSALTLPLAERSALQWIAAVTATFVLYSLATRAIVARASAAGTAPSRRT